MVANLWSYQRYIWCDVGYDIHSLNITVCSEILIFLGDLYLVKLFFFYSSQRPHSNHVFSPRFNHSSIVTYVISNRWQKTADPHSFLKYLTSHIYLSHLTLLSTTFGNLLWRAIVLMIFLYVCYGAPLCLWSSCMYVWRAIVIKLTTKSPTYNFISVGSSLWGNQFYFINHVLN